MHIKKKKIMQHNIMRFRTLDFLFGDGGVGGGADCKINFTICWDHLIGKIIIKKKMFRS